jgi:hypothetical protein
MCYPKPGPRCSADAAKRLAKAKHEFRVYYANHKNDDEMDYNEFDRLKQLRDDAKQEFNITPAGIRALERQVAEGGGSWAEIKLEKARSDRQHALNQLSKKQQMEEVHDKASIGSYVYQQCEFTQDGQPLNRIDENGEDMAVMLQESLDWAEHLSDEEIEAMNHYSQGGYADVNGVLTSKTYKPRGTVESVHETVKHLDSALAKASSNKEVVVYRRHFFYDEDGSFAHLSSEELQEKFPVGSVYEPGFFMSTSLDQKNIPGPDRTNSRNLIARFEIKTHRGASISATAHQGTNEKEFLLPRDGKYRVVNNNVQALVNGYSGEGPVQIIQLEEL